MSISVKVLKVHFSLILLNKLSSTSNNFTKTVMIKIFEDRRTEHQTNFQQITGNYILETMKILEAVHWGALNTRLTFSKKVAQSITGIILRCLTPRFSS